MAKRSHDIKIYLMREQAFVDVGNNFMLCIGSKTEVDEATPQKLVEMINEAKALSDYRQLEHPRTVH